MSVEDPRLSNISEENLTENFSSEIQEEIAASSTPSPIEHEIQVAQAGDGRTPTTNRVPTDPNAPAAAPAAPAAEVTPDANNIVHLATSVSIDDIRVDGANLILVQADGTEIVIVNGAAKIPTMLIGEVEVPQQVLFAALEDSGINVAAGPDGSFSATGRPDSSGAEFEDSIQGSQNDPIQLASLLGDTEFGDGGGLDDRTAADDQPDAFDMGSPFIFSESVLADDVVGNETITGTLAFDGGDDFGIVSSVNYQSTSDMAEGTGSGVAAPLTSGGQPVTVSTSADGLTVTGTITVGETTVTVFTLTVTNPTTGAFTYTQSQPLDHPDLGQIGADDALRLNFTFTVTDKDGDSDTGSFSIEIGDDGPSIASPVTLAAVNEDDLSGGNDEGEHESLVSSAALGISWGADANVKGESEGDTFGRSIAFNKEGLPQGLTSGGVAIFYGEPTVSANGTVTITAYKGIEGPAVFTVTLDPTSEHGTATFELKGALDHASGSDALPLTFSYTATDADGDSKTGSFSVTVDDDIPVIRENSLVQLDDDALTGGNAGGSGDDADSVNATGVLAHAYGADGAGSVSWIDSGLTLPEGFHASASDDGKVMTIFQGERAVVSITITDSVTGAYQVTQLAPINHPEGTSPGTEDNLQFTVSYQVTDKDGDTAATPGTLTINIDDDTAKIGTPFAGGIVEEEQGAVIGAGNEDMSGAGDADALFGLLDRTTQNTGGTLAISWGSDNADNEAITSGAGNRSVSFGPAAIANLEAQGLTSRGLDLVYTLSADGTMLTAHAGTEGGQAVFTVTLSDNGNGSYSFTLIDTLDHPASGEDQIALNFQFTATDSDGDTTDPAIFTVKVIDDVPTAGLVFGRYVEEEALAGGNEDVSPWGVELTGAVLNGSLITDKIGASLNISWGGDDSNSDVNGGFTGTQVMGDRSIVFAASASEAATVISAADAAAFLTVKSGNTTIGLDSLTSGGQALVYTLSENGTVLVAHAGTEGGPAVFTVTLSDTGSGRYDFDLDGVLDHPVKASGADNEDVLTFNFTATARDSDGDIVKNTFQVNVIDDSPIAHPGTASTVEDESVNSGNNEDDGYTAKAEHVSLNIQWGADNANDGNGQPGDRSVAFRNANVTVAGEAGNSLTSLGVEVHTAILANGTLVGYTGNTAPTTTGAGNVVFFATVSDVNNGEYNFTLVKPLDHDTSPANSENSLSLRFNYTATDSDGDTSSSTFTVNVVDDVAQIGTPFAGGIVEEEQGAVIGAGNEDMSGAGDADALFGLLDRTTQNTGGTLAISWGSDNADNEAITSGAGNRSVSFGPAAIANLEAQGLTSRGLDLVYTLSADGTMLTAHAGTEGGQAVFTVTLSDNGNGSYSFTLIDTLDHPASGEDQIALNFQFTATDSDGDTTAPAIFTVKVIDDVPTAGTVFARYVEEEALSGGNEDVSPFGVEAAGALLNLGLITDKIGASLNISWGGDDSNTDANGGFTGTQVMGDRSIVFAASNSVAAAVVSAADAAAFMTVKSGNTTLDLGSLTSGGQALVYTLSQNGTVLVAHAGSASGAAVFTVTLSDTGSGRYDFDLDGVLDHPVKASGASNEDVLTFTFTATARDGDGDIVKNNFQVNVIDDSPIAGTNTLVQMDEDAVAHGNPDGNGDDIDAVALTGVLAHASGADGASVLWSTAGVTLPSGFWFSVSPDGTVMTITQDKGGTYVPVVTLTITDTATGAYSVAQVAPINHPQGTIPGFEDNVQFTVSYDVTDGDGDSVRGTISINVDDDTPTVEANAVIQLDDDMLTGGNPGGVGDDVETPVLTGTLANHGGADGIASVLWAPNGLTLPNGFWYDLSADSKTMTITQLQNGSYVNVFKVTITDTATGAYKVEPLNPVAHGVAGSEDNAEVSFQYRVTDGDGDVATGTLTLNIDDDTPVSTGVIGTGAITESAAGGSIEGELSALVSPGADGIGRYSVETTGLSSSLTSLTSGGVALTYSVVGNALVAKAGTTTIFTFSVDPATGAYTFSLTGPLDHVDTAIIGGKVIPAAALNALDIPGSHAALADADGNGLAYVGRMPDDDAVIRVSNSGDDAVTWTLNSVPAGGTPYTLTIPGHTTWYVNVGDVDNQTKFGLSGPGAPNGITNVNPGHSITFVDGDSALALDLSSAVTVTDGDGDSVALDGQLIVTVTDGVPTAAPQTFNGNEDGVISGTVVAAAGADGLASASPFHLATGPAHGTLVFNGDDGTFTFTPAANWNGADSFTYTVTDRDGDTSAPIKVTLDVAAVNDAPVNVMPASVATNEDQAVAISGLQVSDIDSAAGQVSVTLTVSHGTLAVSEIVSGAAVANDHTATVTLTGTVAQINTTLAALNAVTFTPTGDYNGSATLTMTTNDGGNTGSGGALSDSDSITITITPVNDAPVAVNDYFSTNEDTARSGMLLFANDSDIEGNPLTANGITVGGQLGGSISFEQNGTLRFEPLANESGYAILQYGVSDGNLTSTGTVTIDVRPIADTATISGSGLGSEDATAALSLTIALGDTDGSEKVTRVELSGFPAGATFNQGALEGGVWVISSAAGVNTSGLTMTPPANYAGNFNLSVSATVLDSATLSDLAVHTDTKVSTGSIGVSITPVNDGQATISVTDLTQTATDPKVGDVLRATLGSDPDGTASNVVHTWLRDGNDTGVTTADYTLTAADVGHQMSVRTTYVDGQNFNETVTSTATAAVITNNSPPLVVNDTATASGRYAFADNLSPINAVGFDAATLFSGGTGTVTYSYQLISATGDSSWISKSTNFFSGNPQDSQQGVYVYKVTATDNVSSVSTYMALSAIENDGQVVRITNNGNGGATGSPDWVEGYSLSWGDLVVANVANSNNEANAAGGDDVMLGQAGVNHFNGGTSDDTLYGFGGNDVLSGGADNDFIDGGSGDDVITGGTGNDVLIGGSGNDTFNYAIGDGTDIVDGGTGTDTLAISGGFADDTLSVVLSGGAISSFNGSTVTGVETINANLDGGADTLSYAGTTEAVSVNLTNSAASGFSSIAGIDNVTGGSGNDTLMGNGNANRLIGGIGVDSLNGGGGNDILVGDQADTLLEGGSDTDTLQVGANFTSTGNAQINGIEKIELTAAATLNLLGQTEGFSVSMDAGNTANQSWNVTLASNSAKDEIIFNHDALGINNNTVATVSNFETGNDKIAITLGSGGSPVQISNGGYQEINASTNDISNKEVIEIVVDPGSVLDLTKDGDGDAIEDVIANAIDDIPAGTYTVIVYSSTNTTTADAGIYTMLVSTTQSGNSGGNSNLTDNKFSIEHVMTLSGVGYGKLSGTNFSSVTDPIILDLDHNGFAFTSVEDGVKFDIDADGHKDQVAWTKTDGILAFDVDGNGKIDNGSEIFTPNFAGGAHAGGVAALSTLDVNHDGKIDVSDTGFDKLLVWQDANGNGVSDEGELKGLNDYGITGISLDADSAEGYIDGQSLFAEGSFTYADGSTGSFVEVGFDTLFSDAPDHVLVGTDGDDILAAMPGLTQMTGGAGADTFVLDPSALHELDMADIITDYKSSEGDAVDVSKLLDTLLGHQATGEEAAANVRTTIAGNDTTVSVQVATDSWKDVAVLQNHTEAVKILFDDDKHSANISHV